MTKALSEYHSGSVTRFGRGTMKKKAKVKDKYKSERHPPEKIGGCLSLLLFV